MDDNMYLADLIAESVARKVLEELSKQQVFTPEDIALIRDHVKPNGVAFKNGYRTAIEEVEKCIDQCQMGASLEADLLELLRNMKER